MEYHPQAFHQKVITVLTILKKELPTCFKRGHEKLPLCVAIYAQVCEHYKNDARFTRRFIYKAIGLYTHGPQYLKNLKAGTPRIDIHGKPVEVVSEKEAAYAKELLKKRKPVRVVSLHKAVV